MKQTTEIICDVLERTNRKNAEQTSLRISQFEAMEKTPVSDASKEVIAKVDELLAAANMSTYSDLLNGLLKLHHQAGRFERPTVQWIHEHISPLYPK